MARKATPPRSPSRTPRKASTQQQADASAAGGKSSRERIIAAFMTLLAEKSIEQIGLAEIAGARRHLARRIARRCSVPSSRSYAAHMKEIDRQVLAGIDPDMAEEPPRERLFDVLMRRIEALAPHKDAVRSLVRSAARNPGLASRSTAWRCARSNGC